MDTNHTPQPVTTIPHRRYDAVIIGARAAGASIAMLGWALVGDAGYLKDPFAAHGISDAFRDAELLTDAIMSGDFARYESSRDRLSTPLFDTLDRIASFEWDLDTLPGLHLDLSKAMKAEVEALDGIRAASTVSIGGWSPAEAA